MADNSTDDPIVIHPDDIIYWMGFMMESQQRNYDVMLAILHTLSLGTSNEGKAKQLQEMHERGEYLFPPPFANDHGDDGDTGDA